MTTTAEKLAELRAGLINLADLQAEQVRGVGTFEHMNDEPGLQPLWIGQVQTERSEYSGFSVVELTVTENSQHEDAVRYTLRALIELREVEGEAEYEADDMLEGL